MKKLILIGGGLLVLLVAGLFVFSPSLNHLIKRGIEKFGPLMTKTTVTVGSVDLSPRSGSGSIENLVVGTPEGFESPQFLSLGKIYLSLDPQSLLKEVIVIHEIVIEAPEITYETTLTSSNLTRIQENLLSFSRSKKESAESTGSGSKKMIIEHVLIKSGKIRYSNTLTAGQTVATPLPSLELHDLGKSAGGISSENALGEILKAVIRATASSANPTKALDAIKGIFQ